MTDFAKMMMTIKITMMKIIIGIETGKYKLPSLSMVLP